MTHHDQDPVVVANNETVDEYRMDAETEEHIRFAEV